MVVDVRVDRTEDVGDRAAMPTRAENDEVVAAPFQFGDDLLTRMAATLHRMCTDIVG